MSADAILTTNGIHAGYVPGVDILRGLSITARANEITLVIGPNGAGKSTLLRSIFGFLKPHTGTVSFQGRDVTGAKPSELKIAGISYVTQDINSFPLLTVEENLHIGAIAQKKKLNGQLDRVFQLFPILEEFLPRKGGMLSGGQQQQLAIARALLTDPKVLILDEPTEGIQPNIIDQIGEAIKLLRAEGKMSILLVEQYLDFCRELADDFAIMDRGVVVAAGPVATLTDDVVKAHLTV